MIFCDCTFSCAGTWAGLRVARQVRNRKKVPYAPCWKCREYIRLEHMSETNELRIAVIGAGPAGVYSSDIFLRQLGKLGEELGLGTKARIDLFEKLPVPFGLVRYGVAPDHPSIKFIASALEKTSTTRTSTCTATWNSART